MANGTRLHLKLEQTLQQHLKWQSSERPSLSTGCGPTQSLVRASLAAELCPSGFAKRSNVLRAQPLRQLWHGLDLGPLLELLSYCRALNSKRESLFRVMSSARYLPDHSVRSTLDAGSHLIEDATKKTPTAFVCGASDPRDECLFSRLFLYIVCTPSYCTSRGNRARLAQRNNRVKPVDEA